MTPSLGTLEKMSDALGLRLDIFFIADNVLLLEHPFIRVIIPYLWDLNHAQWLGILERMAELCDERYEP